MFITAFATARHLPLSWAKSIQYMSLSLFLKIRFNIVLPSTPRYFKYSLSLSVPYSPVLSPYVLLPRPSHSSWFDYSNNSWWGLQFMNLHFMQSSPLPCYFFPFGSNIFLNTTFSNTLSLYPSLNVTQQVSCSYNTRVGTLIVATIYLQLIQNRYMFRSFPVLQCSH